MEFRWKHPHSGYNAGITRRGEGSENASLGGKWCLFSDPSPLRANQPNLQNGNVILMMWFYSFQRLFKIRMVITQLLCDEMVINSRNIDGISVETSPILCIMPAVWVRAGSEPARTMHWLCKKIRPPCLRWFSFRRGLSLPLAIRVMRGSFYKEEPYLMINPKFWSWFD
jgi:hypothetical protein